MNLRNCSIDPANELLPENQNSSTLKSSVLHTVDDLREINPDEWNNVPIPVTSTIKTVI